MATSRPSPEAMRMGTPLTTRQPRVRGLRTQLSMLLVVNVLLTYLVVMTVLMLWRLPIIEQENSDALQTEVQELSRRVGAMLGMRESRMELLARLTGSANRSQVSALLHSSVSQQHLFRALYWMTDRGIVDAMDVDPASALPGIDLIGNDLSALPLFRQALRSDKTIWSGDHLSPLSGSTAIGIAIRERDHVLVGEVTPDYLYAAIQAASRADASRIWMVTPSGQILAETGNASPRDARNIRNLPVLEALRLGKPPPTQMQYEGHTLQVAVSHAPALGWYFIGTTPGGIAHPRAQGLILYATGAFLGCVVTGLLIAPFWARRLSRPLQEIVERAALATSGKASGLAWPHGTIREFNALSDDLARMANTLQQRERKLSALFNAAPIPMVVYDICNGYRVQDVNDAWCRELGYTRERMIGRTALEIGLWRSAEERQAFIGQHVKEIVSGEATLLHGDGQPMLFQTFGREITLDEERLMVWGSLHIGPLRQAELELRELNIQLEARINRRTHALADSNEELRATVEHLKLAQAELVRTEKMAALGALVAGVAHELNTPLGNSVMAVSTMREATRDFRKAMETGLRRTDLQHFIDQVEQGTDISARNLHRAADLVQNFKQVAVDQTSSQRRVFELHDVVHEMVVSLRPSFNRTPYRIEVQMPTTGLRLDSFPGALGQAIGNLIQNAMLHGFDGRDHGTVRLSAESVGDGIVVLRVADDGHGIPAHLIDRIFEPFMTTKMGQGGTGLGLHISYNAIVNLLGGTLAVFSQEGQGACFEMHLPTDAPRHAPTSPGPA